MTVILSFSWLYDTCMFVIQMEKIDLKKALDIIHGGDWFSIRVITADVNRGTGGEVLEIARARLARRQINSGRLPAEDTGETNRKNPNHFANFTVNLEMFNKKIRKVHPILITHINNLELL